MTTQVIPTGDDVVYSQTTSLDGVPYLLRFSFNQREQTWWLLLSTGDGDPIYGSVKLVVSFPLFASCADSRKPPGKLIVVSSTTDLSPPGLEDLVEGGRCQLCYIPAADLATIGQNEAALSGTCDVENASTAIVFSQAQTLQAGTVLVFSEQPGTPYVLETSITNATFGTLTTPYSGASGNGAVAEVLSSGTLLAPLLSQAVGSGAAPEALDGLIAILPGISTATSGANGPLTYNCPATSGAPPTTSGLVLWTRGDSITTVGGVVTSWADQSGHGNNEVQATVGAQPTYAAMDSSFANRPSVTFDGARQFLSAPSVSSLNLTAATMAFALKMNAAVGSGILVKGSSTVAYDYGAGTNRTHWCMFYEDANPTALSNNNYDLNPHALIVQMGPLGQLILQDGMSLPVTQPGSHTLQTNSEPLFLGCNSLAHVPQSFSPVTVADALLYNRLLTTSELAGVNAYLQARYFTQPNVIGGDPAYTYAVTFRFRGVVEQKTYTGASAGCCNEPAVGTNAAFFVTGGTAAGDNFAVYSLTVSNPNFTYYLNAGVSGAGVGGVPTVFEIDYEVTIPVNGGATVTLSGNSIDSLEVANQTDGLGGVPISIPGVSVSQPYVGQFVQMNVVNVR